MLDIQLAVMAYAWCTCGNVWPVFLGTCMGLWPIHLVRKSDLHVWPHFWQRRLYMVILSHVHWSSQPGLEQKIFHGHGWPLTKKVRSSPGSWPVWIVPAIGHFLVFAFGCCWQKLVTGASHGFCSGSGFLPLVVASLWGQGKSLELGKLNCQMEICFLQSCKRRSSVSMQLKAKVK